MLREFCRAKLHMAAITGARLNYSGSLTVDPDLMEAVGLLPMEKVTVANANTGDRFETYMIPGTRGKREVVLNGAAARLGCVGDRLIVICFALVPENELGNFQCKVAVLDEKNEIVQTHVYGAKLGS